MRRLRRLILPVVVFLSVLALHYAWLGVFPERSAAQARWETVSGEDGSWFSRYLERQSYWQGYAYGLSMAFGAVALRRFREKRLFGAGKLAIGGTTLSGFLAVTGCFLAGCCGSPMLGGYLSLFGASFLPWTKPLVAGVSTLTIGASYLWMLRRERQCCCSGEGSKASDCAARA